jgi:putative oxidoreductase
MSDGENLMTRLLGRFEEQICAIARFVIGALFACHGAQKLFGVLGGKSELHDPMGLTAGIIEFFGGLMIAVGLFGSIVAVVACAETAFAHFRAQAPGGFWPIMNRGELAVIYCFFFLFVAAHGSGRFSLDALNQEQWREELSSQREIF